jgi:hypothetical protein
MIVPFLNGEMFDVELVHGRKDEAIFDQNKSSPFWIQQEM